MSTQIRLSGAALADGQLTLKFERAVTIRPESLAAFDGGKSIMRGKVLGWLEAHGPAGATADELAHERDLCINSVAPRLTELCESGQAVRTSQRRETRAGASAAVIVAGRWA